MSVRVGEAGSRFTTDLDAARPTCITLGDYLDELSRHLQAGWSGFTGTLEQLAPARPDNMPEQYVMQPFKIRLAYLSRHWLSVPFELGHDEIGSTEQHDLQLAPEIVDLFATIDKLAVATIAARLFEFRHAQTWPPTVVVHPTWPAIYAEAADGLVVRADGNDTVEWTTTSSPHSPPTEHAEPYQAQRAAWALTAP